MAETSVWKGSPSQVVNLGVFVLCGLTFFLVVPIFIALWYWLKTRSDVYEITTERILHSVGVFSRKTDTLELYRVKDIRVDQPFFLRLFKLCNIEMHTSDHTNPIFVLPAMSFAEGLQDHLRVNVEKRRDEKRVREVDFDMGESG
ncbi:MAG TPA: PH domain-containing protein [Candidatus Hydrogenedentes bacterium]|nr:PH domain-containing protein [Candidatus Hydrogenedentota bacterium]HRK36259.1 PH domain-containing protein [Candidatus Hydrogenedentota bacterium]